ncbi:MAG: integrase core domain-containing protein, partial [Rhodococcus sp. (in: high G+C Gram-positive bacteria)]|uniref:integrase core domain-containing protein n=1 Tax=Rhodococcus sp. TaxID=1831 RepID=UPI003BB0AB92
AMGCAPSRSSPITGSSSPASSPDRRPVEVLFERTCREYGITARLTKRRSPTTTGKIEPFHRTLRFELLDEVGAFATIEAARAAIDDWIHAYNTHRPHQSLDMATPASLFRARQDEEPTTTSTPSVGVGSSSAPQPIVSISADARPLEIDLRVPPSGIVDLVGAQQIWVGKSDSGRTVTLWADLASVHVVLDDDVVKTIVSRLTTADLDRLAMRGARPGRPAPALPAFDPAAPSADRVPIEVDRTATRDGIVALLGHQNSRSDRTPQEPG